MDRSLILERRSLRTFGVILTTLAALGWQEAPAQATIFMIPDGDVPALIDAIEVANTNGEADEIILARDGSYVVDTVSSHLAGGNAFPLIEPDPGGAPTIQGRGSTIRRDPSADPMRFFYALGTLYLNDLTLEGGLIDYPFYGGGAIQVHSDASVIMERVVLRSNAAFSGAAILADGYVELRDSEIRDNVFEHSTTAVVASSISIFSSTFRDNGGPAGGAILSVQSALLHNTTIAHNIGFGVRLDAPPFDGYLELSSATIFENSGVGLIVDGNDSSFLYADSRNTVIAQNGSNCAIDAVLNGIDNVTDDDSCPTDGTFDVVADVMLAPLSDNGGATLPGNTSPWTMSPMNGSPLIEAGDADTCVSVFWDQVGNERSIDGDLDQSAICDVGAIEYQAFQPSDLAVDEEPLNSDGNGIFEPGETIRMTPWWEYDSPPLQSTLTGELGGLEGPDGPGYVVVDDTTGYGAPAPGEAFTCGQSDTDHCYSLEIVQFESRPAGHWDATVAEYLYSPEIAGTHRWTLHIGDSFEDVPRGSTFYEFVETALHRGVTAGCTTSRYCGGSNTTRQQLAVFVLKAVEGSNYAPPPCEPGSQPYDDVFASNPFCPWIQELATRNVTAGCGSGLYCPTEPVSRAQMAVFVLKALEGGDFVPAPCKSGSETFADVPAAHLFCPWIEELVDRGIVSGCSSNHYCPGDDVSRAQMSVFATRTFGLELYGP